MAWEMHLQPIKVDTIPNPDVEVAADPHPLIEVLTSIMADTLPSLSLDVAADHAHLLIEARTRIMAGEVSITIEVGTWIIAVKAPITIEVAPAGMGSYRLLCRSYSGRARRARYRDRVQLLRERADAVDLVRGIL